MQPISPEQAKGLWDRVWELYPGGEHRHEIGQRSLLGKAMKQALEEFTAKPGYPNKRTGGCDFWVMGDRGPYCVAGFDGEHCKEQAEKEAKE